MNKNLIILIAGLAILGVGAVATDPNVQKTLGLNSSSKPTNSKRSDKNKELTVNKDSVGIETVKVSRVIDGDTVELSDGRKIRLLNMDTPETVKPNSPVMCFGKEASDYTKKNLTDKMIQIVPDKEPSDRYGRALRMVYLQGKDITKVEESFNAELVRGGYARVKSYSPNKTFEKPLQAVETEAKTKKSGAWSACPEPFVK